MGNNEVCLFCLTRLYFSLIATLRNGQLSRKSAVWLTAYGYSLNGQLSWKSAVWLTAYGYCLLSDIGKQKHIGYLSFDDLKLRKWQVLEKLDIGTEISAEFLNLSLMILS